MKHLQLDREDWNRVYFVAKVLNVAVMQQGVLLVLCLAIAVHPGTVSVK